MTDLNKAKYASLEAALLKGVTRVVICPKDYIVLLPTHLRTSSEITLNLSHRFATGVSLDEEGFHTALSFNGERSIVSIPWAALRLIVDVHGHSNVFPLSPPSPPEVLVDRTEELKLELIVTEHPVLTPPRRGHLRLVN